jgi:Flp pilus assembly protein protease CpaA
MTLPWWGTCAAGLALGVVAMIIELRTNEIPNWLTLGTLTVAWIPGLFDKTLVDHLLGFAITVLVTAILYRRDLLGGGSVKWTCAVGTLIGARNALVMLAVAGLFYVALYVRSKLRAGLLAWIPSTPLVFLGVLAALVKGLVSTVR